MIDQPNIYRRNFSYTTSIPENTFSTCRPNKIRPSSIYLPPKVPSHLRGISQLISHIRITARTTRRVHTLKKVIGLYTTRDPDSSPLVDTTPLSLSLLIFQKRPSTTPTNFGSARNRSAAAAAATALSLSSVHSVTTTTTVAGHIFTSRIIEPLHSSVQHEATFVHGRPGAARLLVNLPPAGKFKQSTTPRRRQYTSFFALLPLSLSLFRCRNSLSRWPPPPRSRLLYKTLPRARREKEKAPRRCESVS